MSERFNVLSRLMIGIDGVDLPDYLSDLVSRGLRSVVIYGNNLAPDVDLADFVSKLRSVLGEDAIIAIDEEGGDVTRVDYLSSSRFAGNAALGKLDDLSITTRDGKMLGQLLANMGINLNFAPVADVNINPSNPVIGNRSFGASPELVARHVAAFVQGMQTTGVGATLKHFPGHGDVAIDSHESLPLVSGGWEAIERDHLEPFIAGIEAGAAAIMIGHLDLGDGIATSLSEAAITRLREALGFTGLVVTDALDMGAITKHQSIPEATVAALLAGNDLACMGPNTNLEDIEKVVELWNRIPGELSEVNMANSAARMSEFLESFQPKAGPDAAPEYDLDIEVPQLFRDAAVFRVVSGSNPAVGEVPWFAQVSAEDVTIDELAAMTFKEPSIVLVRGVSAPQMLSDKLRPEQLKNLLVISSDPVWENYPAQHIVTFGTAKPQGEAVARWLTRKEI